MADKKGGSPYELFAIQLGLFGVALSILKATNTIALPMVWVLAPFWIPLGISVVALIFVGLLTLVIKLTERKRK